ncbi:succinate dehydrogenase, hydrophobic membrane anchor protein [Varunaivibrio sulfuroxidans]|uniref:Succinate dehydrogenase hydrophobic membrane anchor subunit n=1 Tax=Varunaivibrio sulfuroxidans TaxID=1773489 RepID=A0A4R3JD48_9PROT|nr:succinate dehydrogenase, hydrophobic membrane anchor protein [Varunaivibrio sulfuroxidans]TCS63607.1 succinate dehydrogenase subunit D [Varunaivibrio sulfuroxidans]WES30252.1 succinate dehydrogenase, hydrophobic membrane anchor protein [Varunaivibrio sulfuroxidans]
MAELRSSLGRVRGLGSTREGVLHWWSQRMTSVALVPLSLWFVYSVITLTGADYQAFQYWLSEFGNTVFMVLFILTLFHHAQLGVQVVIEDYVHGEAWKMGSLIAVKYAAVLFGASCIFAVLKISFAG